MKTKLLLLVTFFVCCVWTADSQTGNVFVAQTFKAKTPDGGTAAERDSLYMEWLENVVKKNEKIVGRRDFRHYFGQDSRDWVVITEYRSLSDFEIADSLNGQLARKRWPDDKKRAEFFQKLTRYWETVHADEVYRILPKFTK